MSGQALPFAHWTTLPDYPSSLKQHNPVPSTKTPDLRAWLSKLNHAFATAPHYPNQAGNPAACFPVSANIVSAGHTPPYGLKTVRGVCPKPVPFKRSSC